MNNLIDNNNWTMRNVVKNGKEFTLTNGKMSQLIRLPQDETKYKLNINCVELTDVKSYFLFRVVAIDGKHTYLIPVMFLGENPIEINLVKDIRTIEIFLIGSLKITDIGFYENGAITESQKEAIGKVESESEKWDRIVDVTNEQGNLVTSRLEGSINNALNSIFGGNGTMEIIDGTIMFRDGATDATSHMAMRINFAGLAIADSKKADGTWDWKTFGTGQGFTADYMTTGTLSAITIDGVTITATDIMGGTITGAVIDGGTTQEGVIKGYVIEGSTLKGARFIGGDVQFGDKNNILTYINGTDVWLTHGDNSLLGLSSYMVNGITTNAFIVGGMKSGNPSTIYGDGVIYSRHEDGMLIKNERAYVPIVLSTNKSMVEVQGDLRVTGNIHPSNIYSRNISTLEVENMELKYELKKQALSRSELEVTLMEKGVL